MWLESTRALKGFEALLAASDTEIKRRVEAVIGNENSLGGEEFDFVFCREVISHVRELVPFIAGVDQHVDSEGIFFIEDGNNLLNPYSLFSSTLKGLICEFKGGVACADFKAPYRVQREEIIRRSFPEMGASTVEFLSKKTQGMWGDEILVAVRQYANTGKISRKTSYRFRDPVTGQCEERILNPYALAKFLGKMSYDVMVKPYFGKFEVEHRSLAGCIKKFPLSCALSPHFWIVARKALN
jgi:hypothetical protein